MMLWCQSRRVMMGRRLSSRNLRPALKRLCDCYRCNCTSVLVTRRRQSSSSEATGGPYIEDWFRSIAKDSSFYAQQAEEQTTSSDEDSAAGKVRRRCYFYNIDLQGRLFLEETFPKNIATSIKDERFLDFFFRRVKPVDEKMQQFMEQRQIPVGDYPYVSLCGRELNYIRPAASPVVFHTLLDKKELVYGGNLRHEFDWRRLAVSSTTGRIYHSFGDEGGEVVPVRYGLIRSQLAISLAECMEATESASGDETLGLRTEDGGIVEIPWLPSEAEPGPWAMPSEYE